MQYLPDDFVYLADIDSSIVQDIRYATSNNFTGQIVDGYINPVAITKKEVSLKLKKVQEELMKQGRGIKVFD